METGGIASCFIQFSICILKFGGRIIDWSKMIIAIAHGNALLANLASTVLDLPLAICGH